MKLYEHNLSYISINKTDCVHTFHAKPIGGHFGLHNTVVRIRLRFFWPGLYTFFKNMISRCAVCALAVAMTLPSNELIYGFPIDGPMNVLHVDSFTVGKSINYAGDKGFLIAACGMCTFSVAEPVPESNLTTYDQDLSMIMLQFGLAHKIVLDKDSKFYDVLAQFCLILDLNVHTVSSENNYDIIVERVN